MVPVHEFANRLKRLDRIVIKEEVATPWNLSDLNLTGPQPGQIGERFVGVAIEKQTRCAQVEKFFDESPGIGFGYRLECGRMISANIHVQRQVVRDSLVTSIARQTRDSRLADRSRTSGTPSRGAKPMLRLILGSPLGDPRLPSVIPSG